MELAIPILPVDDLDVAREFYVDRLGFEVRFDHRGEGTDGLLGIERGSIQITLDCPMTGHGRETHASRPCPVIGQSSVIWIDPRSMPSRPSVPSPR